MDHLVNCYNAFIISAMFTTPVTPGRTASTSLQVSNVTLVQVVSMVNTQKELELHFGIIYSGNKLALTLTSAFQFLPDVVAIPIASTPRVDSSVAAIGVSL